MCFEKALNEFEGYSINFNPGFDLLTKGFHPFRRLFKIATMEARPGPLQEPKKARINRDQLRA
jgi:hypothetical protein